VITKDAMPKAAVPPKAEKILIEVTTGYLKGGFVDSVKYSSAPTTSSIEDMPWTIRHIVIK